MITRAQINKAINERITAAFSGVPLQSSDIEEGFSRPSFYVSLETPRTESNQFSLYREMTCRIRYFPTNRNASKEETYEVQDRLEILFGLNFRVSDRTITIETADSDVVDKVLYYNFNFAFSEDIENVDPEVLMQELNFNG
jgi:hypothetical protein